MFVAMCMDLNPISISAVLREWDRMTYPIFIRSWRYFFRDLVIHYFYIICNVNLYFNAGFYEFIDYILLASMVILGKDERS